MKKFTIYSALCIVSACTFLFSTGKAFASWYSQSETVNTISMKSVKGQIVEEYEQNQVVYPNAEVNKIVQVKNTGNTDALPRVKIEKVWGERRDENGKLLIDPDLSTDNIEIIYNTDEWFYQEEDGYFYYKGVLRPGDITVSLFDSFKINGEKTNGDYKNKQADIIVTMEMIQADNNGPSYWNTSFEELGVIYVPTEQINMITKVCFNEPDEGFTFDVNNGDLFSNFKNLIPGESRSQIIEVSNIWENPVEIFLWAEFVLQEQATEETRELINKLVYEYTKITITDEDGALIYDGTVWGNLDIDSESTNSMKYPYSLGVFSSHQTKRLNVSLYLDPKMDNECQELLGLVKWVFSAQGADVSTPSQETTTPSSTEESNNQETETSKPNDSVTTSTSTSSLNANSPKTNDSGNIGLYSTLAVLSLITFLTAYKKSKST